MIDHFGICVADYERSRDFYVAALAPLGYSTIMELTKAEYPELPYPTVGGLGEGGKPDFWLHPGSPPTPPMHIAFQAKTRAQVDEFHKVALAAGARDNGPPGIRAHYHPNYYGAFVIDLNGHNLEVVCHTP